MNELTQFLVDSILNEEKKEIIGIYGGGFKPPIKGHYGVVEAALEDYPEMDKLIVSVGKGVRDGIEQVESLLVWDIYQKYLPMKVEIGASSSGQPIKDIYKLAKENPDKTIYWIIGAREGKEEDFADVAQRTKRADKYPNLEVKLITTGDASVSGTNARKALKSQDKEAFFKFLPSVVNDEEKEEIYNLVSPVIKETSNPQDGKAAPYGSGYDEIEEKKDPKKGTGKKPKGSGRRLYTDEDPSDTVSVKFSTRQDIVDTLNKKSFKAKSHARQSQIINLIHQRVRAAYNRAKDPDVKKRLKTALDYAEQRKEASKAKTQRLKKQKLKENASYSKEINIKEKIDQLTQHMIDKGMNIEPLPSLEFVNGDTENARDFFGKTAYYEPGTQTIVLYTEGRHPKDIVRSYAHEMIHHIQNLEGRLGNITTTNTQEDDALNDIEAEANLKGTMTFRNWTDSLNEVGDATQKPYNWNRTISKDPDDGLIEGVDYRFTTDLDTNYVAFFQMVGPMEYEFGFNIPGGNQAQVSNKGELFRVMATMVAIMKDFMDLMGNDWSEISFSGSKDPSRSEDNRRDKLYMAYIKKNLPSTVNVGVDDDDMTVLSNTLAESLNEIGDASAGVFPYNKNRIDTIVKTLKDKIENQPDAKWQQHLLPFLRFDSPNAEYNVITTAQVNKPLILPDFQADPVTIDLRVDFMVGESDEATNIGEQYKVMATMTQIIKELIAKISKLEGPRLDSVKIFPKSDDGSEEADVDSKRGKLYQAYVEKNLPQGWKVGTGKNAWGSYIALYPTLEEGFDKKLGKDPFGLNAFARELMTEGAYDALTTKLTNATINKWVEDSKQNPIPKKSFVDIDVDEVDGKGREIEFNYVGLVEFTDKVDGYEVDGTSNSGEDEGKMPFVATLFKINPKVLPQAWSKISADVSDVIRHEIEHLTQAGDNTRSGKYMQDDIDIRDLINKAKVLPQKNYYMLEKEVDAMLQGLYLKAKKTKKPFKDVLKNYLDMAPGIETKEDRETILNLWRSRSKALSLPVFENEEKVMDYVIFLDMDGVLVDFDKQFKELTGMMPREFEAQNGIEKFWEVIDGAGVGFWRGMKWMPGGEELYNRASQFKHYLLSSPSRSEVSKIGKRLWRKDKTPNTKLYLARSYNKRKFAAPNHILIDDRESNIQQWRDAGGIGILYKSAEQVNAELDKLSL